MSDSTPTLAPIELTVVLSRDGSATATLTAKTGIVGIMRQFSYADQNDVAEAILQAAWDLTELEVDPPPSYDKPAKSASKPAAPAPSPAPEAVEETVEETVEEAAEIAGEEETPEVEVDDFQMSF